ncbi:MAG: lytic murein transglycosylase [Variovorax paradoxus]|nr:MAG: lytic murein transglycosylase [Variovorax paradoxus]PZQ02982.1 MAG: lytic murein transglycosylase [Variovorax paradoxus]
MPLTHRHRTLAPLLAALVMTGCATAPAPQPATPPASTTPAAPPSASAPPGAAVPAPAAAVPLNQDFAQWVERFRAEARAGGITEATLHAAFDGVRHLDQVVTLDRSQPEFTRAVWDYLDTAVSPTRVSRGQDKLLDVRAYADAAAARYGVPAEIVVAIWGMESNYGSNYGDTPTIDALATLGFEGRRAAWARGQLMAALRILQNGDIPRERMLGSWAGAMGQTQFLPSNFLAYAVDADGDGRRDIWGSMADVTASTAHFLAREGWQRGQPWGLEVQLPPGFDLGRADDALRQPGAQWAEEGVRTMDGTALPDLPDASLLLPAGARGPVFLVGPNFRAILRYNNATSYALGVGLLAQRIAGGPAIRAAWPRDLKPLSRNALQTLQQALQSKGFNPGSIDGVLGPATRGAIRRWQRSVGLAADGFPTHELLDRLQQP